MKLKNKAIIPIGTILLIAVVIIAGFGIYWYINQQESCVGCEKVTHGNGAWMIVSGYDNDVPSQYVGLSLTDPDEYPPGWNIRYHDGQTLKTIGVPEDQVVHQLKSLFGENDIRYTNGKLIFKAMTTGYCGTYPFWNDCP